LKSHKKLSTCSKHDIKPRIKHENFCQVLLEMSRQNWNKIFSDTVIYYLTFKENIQCYKDGGKVYWEVCMRIEHIGIWATWRIHRYLLENWGHILIRIMFCSSFFHAHFDFYYCFLQIIHFLFLSETLNLNVIFSMNLSFNWHVITVNLFYLDKAKVVTGNMLPSWFNFLFSG
jgi:hypothetical protein